MELIVGILLAVTGWIWGEIRARQSDAKLDNLQKSFDDLASAWGVARPYAISAATAEGKTEEVELRDAIKLADRAVVTIIPAAKMEFTAYPPTVSTGPKRN